MNLQNSKDFTLLSSRVEGKGIEDRNCLQSIATGGILRSTIWSSRGNCSVNTATFPRQTVDKYTAVGDTGVPRAFPIEFLTAVCCYYDRWGQARGHAVSY